MNTIVPKSIEAELKDSYLAYAMSVIVSRALPDVRDGLKPVHRRILYSMYESNYIWSASYRKSARIIGDVMGKYHPHGEGAIYDAMVRMAQDFSLRIPLIDGQGNFGSVDGDPAAATRYTEARIASIGEFLLRHIREDTVEMTLNYDGSEKEPIVLPVEFPNLLVNGSSGVAVGMATNIPPHNLGEVIDACKAFIENEEALSIADIIQIIAGPDFPTGGIIMGYAGIKSAFETGKGIITVRGKTHIEDNATHKAIVVDEIPYQVNKVKLIENIAQLLRDKKIEGISDLRDESDRHGIRIVMQLKKNAIPDIILAQLFHNTSLQTSFGINTMVLNQGQPSLHTIKEVIAAFIEFRIEVVTRRTKFRLRKAKEKALLLLPLCLVIKEIDKTITIIKASKSTSEAIENLINIEWAVEDDLAYFIEIISNTKLEAKKYVFTKEQAQAVLDMRLNKLTSLEKDNLYLSLKALIEKMEHCLAILGSKQKIMEVISEELDLIKEKFATPRKTIIEPSEADNDIEELIPKENMIVTVTASGYVKRVRLSNYKTQHRGGKGKLSSVPKHNDMILQMFIADTHSSVLLFSNLGQVYKLKIYKLPLVEPLARGRAFVNIVSLSEDEVINNVMLYPTENVEELNILFATSNGNIRRNNLTDFAYIPSNGKIAIRLDEGDALISVKVCIKEEHATLATAHGKIIRFPVSNVRLFKGRTSDGVRGIRLVADDRVISMSILSPIIPDQNEKEEYLKIPVLKRVQIKDPDHKFFNYAQNEEFLLTLTENGFGKRSSAYEYRVTARGGVGVVNMITSKRNGKVVSSFPVNIEEQVMIMTNKGHTIRISISGIRVTGRNTQGITLLKTQDLEHVVSATRVIDEESVNTSDEAFVDIPEE